MGKCENCIYWFDVDDPNEAINECRRNAPIAGYARFVGIWPLTKANNCCGEFKEKDNG